jgi:hypothetical protein
VLPCAVGRGLACGPDCGPIVSSLKESTVSLGSVSSVCARTMLINFKLTFRGSVKKIY